MSNYYSKELNVQMLIFLLKKHNISHIIASPGVKNFNFIGSLQHDPFFKIYSAADERSAAYIACGMAVELNAPVVLSCTGATASRNYLPALTEAYYRKIPILAVTSMSHFAETYQNIPQNIDRSVIPNDVAKYSVNIPTICNEEDEWIYGVKMNEAILELSHNGFGPVHINLATTHNLDFSSQTLKNVKIIKRITNESEFPPIDSNKIAIIVGAHSKWSDELTKAVDEFCEKYNSFVVHDHTSNYKGDYGIQFALFNQDLTDSQYVNLYRSFDLLINIGDISGAYLQIIAKEVWRVNEDGLIHDTYKKLTNVFQIDEESFFKLYSNRREKTKNITNYSQFKRKYSDLKKQIVDLPFSNLWVALQTAHRIPENSILHLGILNSLRTWNFFEIPKSVSAYSNTGGFGIDGILSTLLGASLVNPNKLYFGVIGDLAFFYDMNALGNRHLGNNLRLLIINNGKGQEFRQYNNHAAVLGEDADKFVAAAGHYGNKSPILLKHYAQDLGLKYLSASNKDEFIANIDEFLSTEYKEKSILFEVFTTSEEESDALYQIRHLEKNPLLDLKIKTKEAVKRAVGEKGLKIIKRILK